MNNPPIIEVFHNGHFWDLAPGLTGTSSTFGGPVMHTITSELDLDGAVIHNIATLKLVKFGVTKPDFGFDIPLIFGVCHEGCEIGYRKTATHAVEITKLDPEEADEGFPYYGYPPVIPFYQLGVIESGVTDGERLKDSLYNTGWEVSESKLYVIIRQHPNVGHCLFEGDEDTEIAFEYCPDSGTFRGVTQCT
ncbi:MAG: hypothetical protein MI807_03920 [Verrucomicrobiales bacterium]|nr:hypothetical protein [Verrucomicrobiales bacterium]